MSDLISRKKAMQGVQELFSLGECYCDELSIVGMLNGLSSAEQEQKKGKWIFHLDNLFPEESTQECSICHEEEFIKIQNDNFYPNCGADMRDD